ncbi:hypothetical protein RDT67_14485 [Serratia fonticola]|uniref:Uncharacterized protein n=1 Tax=Serratia fonticola TaxID=47917 RepID=A0AAJ1YE48_SERFO|nr:hypothetical protein [Serratia fonticola]MDQ9127637.1 hypothetical protein [Serratia fonticola]
MRERTRNYTEALPCIGLAYLKHTRLIFAKAPSGHTTRTTTENGILLIARNGEKYAATINGHSFTLSLTTTQAGYGVRYWYTCPHCHQRCAKLYIGREDIACRKCWGLHYATQSQGYIDRMRRLIRNKRIAIWGHDKPNVMNLFWSSLWFDKPKGMRWETFERKRGHLVRIERNYMNASEPAFNRLIERADRAISKESNDI